MSTTFSHSFKVLEWKSYVIPDGNRARWRPANSLTNRDDTFRPIANKWVYAFQQSGTRVSLAGEYFVDRDGQILPVNLEALTRHLEHPTSAPRPEPIGLSDFRIRLAHTINGRRVFHYFIVSRIRLPSETIEDLRGTAPQVLPVSDLSLLETADNEVEDAERLFQGSDGVFCLRILDPLSIAHHYGDLHRRLRDRLIGYTSVFRGQNRDQRVRTKIRMAKVQIAQSLDGLLAGDPDDDLSLRGEFADGKLQRMREFLTDFRMNLEAKRLDADMAAARLCHWLTGDLMVTMQRSYSVNERENFGKFLKEYARMVRRLGESQPGKAFFAGIMRDTQHFIHKYVFRQEDAEETVFDTTREALSAIIELWEDMAASAMAALGDETVVMLALNRSTRLNLTSVRQVRANGRVLVRERYVELRQVVPQISVQAAARAQLEQVLLNRNVGAVLDLLTGAAQTVSLALALKNLGSAEGLTEGFQGTVELISTFAESVGALAPFLDLSQVTIAKLGAFMAVMDIVAAGMDMADVASRNDYSALAGHAAVGFGAVLVLVGSWTVIAGASAAATGAGAPPGAGLILVGGAIGVTGRLIVMLTEDSPIELFVSHCYWGRHHGSGSDAPAWAGGALSSWRNNFDRQNRALLNLLAGFTMKAADANKVRIFTGQLDGRTKFHIIFEIDELIEGGRFAPRFVVQMDSRPMVQAGGDAANIARIGFGSVGGRRFIEVTAVREPESPGGVFEANCKVHMDFFGDGRLRIPASRDLELRLYTASREAGLAGGLSHETARSVEIR